MIAPGHGANLETIVRAAKNDRLALLECRDRKTGKQIAVLVAVADDGEGYEFIPFARMFEENPYDEFDPPNPEGGFHDPELESCSP